MTARRYNQCDSTCTVDCGHCKGKGKPVGSPDPISDEAVRAALHVVAAQIEAHLRANGAPPIWYRAVDIVHLAAGCKWDDTAGEDGWGEYDCETTEAVR